ncbi:prolyl oligopeptidase family serine peptidase [Pseudalkalibacillus caeni]|uniref:Esterase n=1 Tax=Exobacillus caeni TaxID=2574798 RepID=A0A5R9FDZ5_9BACL|nr:prolyl oligopeptidase family serine peptidase [Pseudalkalibacillus caeni]TLS37845.1 esterase [Pseudalkalibacillus caeni]
MITIRNEHVKDIPVLHVAKDSIAKESLPLVIFQHGFTSAKEHNLHIAYYLAEEGYRVILPEAKHHGVREGSLSAEQRNFSFWDIVVNSIQELNDLKENFVSRGLADEKRIGMSGTSMGGIITFGALTQYSWINTAVSLMGSPAYSALADAQISKIKEEGLTIPVAEEELYAKIEGLKPFDLSLHKEKLAGRPLMVWHSKVDQVVPYAPTYSFYEEIKSSYNEQDRLKFIADDFSGHKVSREAVLETVNWFKKHL